jgi:beta-glucosidase
VVLHNTAKDYPESGQHAISNGLDVIFQTEYKHHLLFIPPFLNASIDSNRINDAVARVLKAKFDLGLFEDPYMPEEIKTVNPHKQIAKQAALESFVLLKNTNNTLPFSKNIHNIAVIGTDATEARLGGYSGPGNNKVSILEGIKQKAGSKIKVTYLPGCGRNDADYIIIPSSKLKNNNSEGLQAAYFNNVALSGDPVIKRVDKTIDFRWTLYGPGEGLDADFYSVRWTGKLSAPVSGKYKIGLEGNDGFRLFINNKLVIDNWQKQSYRTITIDHVFEKENCMI